MGIFADIAAEQLGYLLEEASYFQGKANNIIEFCETPIIHNMNLSDIDIIRLKKIIKKAEKISEILTEFREILRDKAV
jgi:hypothetical protein